MTSDYPYAGCCPHTFNAHDRRHCTACDCTRPPVQVGTAKPATESPADQQELTDVRECTVCRSLLLNESRVAHLDWHEDQLRTLSALIDAAALARGGKPTTKEKT